MNSPSPRVVVYTTSWCAHCKSAKKLLDHRGIPYEEVDAEARWGERFRDALFGLAGQLTVPQIVIDGRAIGGYADLVRMDESGELTQALAQPV